MSGAQLATSTLATSYRQWINWRLVGGDKLPCDIHGNVINAHAPTAWLSFQEASQSQFPPAFVLTKQDPFFLVDLDKSIVTNGSGQSLTETANAVWSLFPGAAVEVSQSGTGLHIIGSATVPATHGSKAPGVEFYTHGRFVAMTGHGWQGDETTDCTTGVNTLISHYKLNAVEQPVSTQERNGPRPEYTGPIDDNQLITMMLNSPGSWGAITGEKCHVRDLWNGTSDTLAIYWPAPGRKDGRPYDASSADAALMAHLAYWTGADTARMQRLFEQSKLYRKERYIGRGHYRLERLLTRARDRCTAVYDRTQKPLPAGHEHAWDKIDMQEFPPVRWHVEGLIPEGVTFLSAKPKMGKSMFAMDLAAATVTGGSFMGRDVRKGRVLYLALEDSLRRIKNRFGQILHARFAADVRGLPISFVSMTDGCPRVGQGLEQWLRQKLAEHDDTVLLVIDTLAMVKPTTKGSSTLYDIDRAALDPLTLFTSTHPGLSALVIGHNRKSLSEDDPIEDISGSTGLTAAVDTLLVMRGAGDAGVTLHGRGRELEQTEIAARLDWPMWTDLGDAEVAIQKTTDLAIINFLKTVPSARSNDILNMVDGATNRTIFRRLKALEQKGIVTHPKRDEYKLVPLYRK